MTLRIISTCQNSCLHCMEESSPSRMEKMSLDTFIKTLDFIDSTSTTTINISGGEPTLHPDILEFLHEACQRNKAIFLLSNGLFLRDNIELRNEIFKLMSRFGNLRLQVTSIKGLYNNFIHKNEIGPILNKLPIYKKIENKIVFVHKLEYGVLPVGNAKKHIEQINKFTFVDMERKAPKCFNSYQIMTSEFNGDKYINKTISILKENSKTSLCVPLVKENGDMVFGEYECCNVVWNIHNKNMKLNVEDVQGPCGSCYTNKNQVFVVDTYLHTYKNKNNKIEESVYFKELSNGN